MKGIPTEKFDVVDSWWRVEFQARVSPHVHIIVWVRDCPTLDEDEGEVTADVEKRFLDFLKDEVTSWNHTPGVPPAQDTNPLISHGNFSSLISQRIQTEYRFTCTLTATVLGRPRHLIEEKVCMIHFRRTVHPKANWRRGLPVSLPQGIAPGFYALYDWNESYGVYDGSRNGPRMKHYNPYVDSRVLGEYGHFAVYLS
ncbi:hypothetical protein E4U46_006088 [Claviceps purpurea]|nr:hypothetical protein E4U46_006088 [Claviceps purpurea]